MVCPGLGQHREPACCRIFESSRLPAVSAGPLVFLVAIDPFAGKGLNAAVLANRFFDVQELGLELRNRVAAFQQCNQRSFLPSAFKIRTTAMIVFQFRVVTGTPTSLSIWPR